MVVNTPESYNKLKLGHFDGMYRYIDVTHQATPDVLLQPHHFEKSTFATLKFISSAGSYIKLYPSPKYSLVEVKFASGENPLGGVPKGYAMYNIHYFEKAKPTTENIDSVLQWTQAQKIDIQDQHDVALSLHKRAAEMNKLTKLMRLDLLVHRNTYKQIQASQFAEHMPNLGIITFGGMDRLTGEEILEKIPAPSNWNGWATQNYAIYHKKSSN